MENTNTNQGGAGQLKPESNIPISPQIPKSAPDLSTGGKDDFLKVNQDIIPPQGEKKEAFYFGGSKVELNSEPAPGSPLPKKPISSPPIPAKEPTPASPVKEALKKEEKAKAVMAKKAANPKLKKNLIAAAVAVFLLALIGGTAYYFYSVNKKIPVTVSVNQPDISLLVDGVEYKNINSPYPLILPRGSHTITARKEGFADLQKTIDVSPTQGSYNLSFELSAYQKIEKIHDKELFFAAYNKELDSLSYLEKAEGGYNLEEFSFPKMENIIMVKKIIQINKVAWSPTFRQLAIKVTNSASSQGTQIPFLAKYSEGTKINWIVNLNREDLVNITAKDLPPAIKNISFNPEGNKIAYLFQDEANKDLEIANIDGSNPERLVQFKTINFEPDVAWSPDGKRIAIFANTENGAQSVAGEVNVYAYNFEMRSISKLTEDGISTGALFSPDGNKLLYQSGNNIMLYDFNAAEGAGIVDLKLQGSLDNCSWVGNQNFVALSSSDNVLYEVKASGAKDVINYQKETLPGNIKSVLYGIGKGIIYLLNNEGVYQLVMEKNI